MNARTDSQPDRRNPSGLYALTLAVFSLGTTEFMISGLLPELADEFRVSVPTAGTLVSVYALAILIGGPLVTLATLRAPRKAVLLATIVVFTAGETLAALAPSFAVLMTARVITAVAHGTLFGIGTVVASGLVPAERRGRAMAVVFGGLTIANVLGVPMGAFVGGQFGWRVAFGVVAVLSVVSLVAVAALVPHETGVEPGPVRKEARVLARPRMWAALAVTALSQAALFATFAYLAPLLTHESGFVAAAVPYLLVVFGLGTLAGTVAGGKATDRNLPRALIGGLIVMAVVLALFSAVGSSGAATVFALVAFGAAAFFINPALQTQVVSLAESAPSLATVINVSAFNVGNTVGPLLGGALIGAGTGYLSLPLLSSALTVTALVVAVGAARRDSRRGRVESGRRRSCSG